MIYSRYFTGRTTWKWKDITS